MSRPHLSSYGVSGGVINYNNSNATPLLPVYIVHNTENGEVFTEDHSCEPCSDPIYMPLGSTPIVDQNGNLLI